MCAYVPAFYARLLIESARSWVDTVSVQSYRASAFHGRSVVAWRLALDYPSLKSMGISATTTTEGAE